MTCRIGSRELLVGPAQDVQLMEPANDLLGTCQLHQRLQDEGFLYLKRVLPSDLVSAARRAVLAHLEASGMVLPETGGRLNPAKAGDTDQGAVPAELACCAEMLTLVESEALKQLMAQALGCHWDH